MALTRQLNIFLTFLKSLGYFLLKSPVRRYRLARRYWSDAVTIQELITSETSSSIKRTGIINYCIRARNANWYLEIGVRNPDDIFNRIDCPNKASVDPGIEFKANPVDFPMTSDEFFEHWKTHIRTPYVVIFIDGLHRAEQVSRDIRHAIEMTSSDGLIILHDCNPPHHEFAREKYDKDGVALGYWNGTTWKAAWEFFFNSPWELEVVDSDRGVGIIDKSKPKAPQTMKNSFYEFDEFASARRDVGYLISWEDARAWLEC